MWLRWGQSVVTFTMWIWPSRRNLGLSRQCECTRGLLHTSRKFSVAWKKKFWLSYRWLSSICNLLKIYTELYLWIYLLVFLIYRITLNSFFYMSFLKMWFYDLVHLIDNTQNPKNNRQNRKRDWIIILWTDQVFYHTFDWQVRVWWEILGDWLRWWSCDRGRWPRLCQLQTSWIH